METNDFFEFEPQYGTWNTVFRNAFAFVGCSKNIDIKNLEIDKPIYLSIMSHRQQLQPILDNPHLFDPAFVNAVRLVVQRYDDIEVK